MKPNMALADRVIRVIIAAIITVLYLTKTIEGTLGLTLMILAVVFTLTSIVNFCPVYSFLAINKWETRT